MKRITLTLCVLLAMVTVSDSACWKCKTAKGVLFTDTPPQKDADCEWLGRCSNTYNEATDRESKAKDAALTQRTSEQRQRESEDKRRNEADVRQRNAQSYAEQVEREKRASQNELNSKVIRIIKDTTDSLRNRPHN